MRAGRGTNSRLPVSNYDMDLNRLRALLAAPMASLFLVLSLCAFMLQRPAPVGIIMPLAKLHAAPGNHCGALDRTIFAQLRKDGSYWINETQIPANELRCRLAEIYENRGEKVIYMLSDPDVSYGEFVNFYSRAASSDSDLRIVLLTRQIQAHGEQCPVGRCCDLEWPDHRNIPDGMIPIPPQLVDEPLDALR
jgi:biopolymer transport protein ExbD